MKPILLNATFAALIAGPALAADLPIKSPFLAPSWTGFYIGGHAGWVSDRPSVTDEAYFDSGATTLLNSSSFAGGGQIGYNWQMGSVVYGIEADGSWAD